MPYFCYLLIECELFGLIISEINSAKNIELFHILLIIWLNLLLVTIQIKVKQFRGRDICMLLN